MRQIYKDRLAAQMRGDAVLPPLPVDNVMKQRRAEKRKKLAAIGTENLTGHDQNEPKDPEGFSTNEKKVISGTSALPPNAASIRMDRPRTVALLARRYIAEECNMDVVVAKAYAKLDERAREQLADRILRDPRFKQAVEDAMLEPGLDERNKAKLERLLWQWAEGDDPVFAPAAVRILAKAMIPEKGTETEKVQPLPLSGLEKGMEKMGLFGTTPSRPDDDEESVQ